MVSNQQSYRLLERTGLQYVALERVQLSESLLEQPRRFCSPGERSQRLNAERFTPFVVAPAREDETGCYDSHNNLIPPEQTFDIRGLAAVEAFRDKWLPLPYSARYHRDGAYEIESNDWVRLFYTLSSQQSSYGHVYDFILCVDTQTAFKKPEGDCCPFLEQHLNKPIVLSPTGPAFWSSASLKLWIEKLGRDIEPVSSHDAYPAYSHFLALLGVLKNILPPLEICEAVGSPLDVHLFLDIGNSRTCGIMVENYPGQPLKPETAFEKLQIRNPRRPNRVWSEPFETRCMFVPSPFDSDYHPTVYTPNFRSPSVLRIGNAVRQELAEFELSSQMFGRCSLTSPKRYLWSEAPNPSPWYFCAKTNDGSIPVIKGDVLEQIAEDGAPKWLSKASIPIEPSYPHCTLMTFFILEVLCQAFSFMNSPAYRAKKAEPISKRILKSLVVTVPNGMVTAERKLYLSRVTYGVDLFWKFFGLPEDRKPSIVLKYDEATCVQLVYLYSAIKNKLGGDGAVLFESLGRPRSGAHKQGTNSIRVASLDIGGGTSDLMITEYVDRSTSAVTQLDAQSLFQEGIGVAGDDVVKNLIRDVLLPGLVKWADTWYGPGEIRLEHLETLFGLPHHINTPEFIEKKKRFMDMVLIPMVYSYLNHAASKDGPDVLVRKFYEFEFSPAPPDAIKKFFTDVLSEIVGTEKGIYPILEETEWEMDRQEVNEVIYTTFYQTFRIFSEVIVQYNCDVVLIAGKMSRLPEIRDIMVDFCPVPPHRIVSLTNFDAGRWYPFDLQRDCIKDAKTVVAVGAALWFFAEELRSLPMFSIRSDRDLIDKGDIFIGQISNRLVKDKDMLFPSANKRLGLVGTTYLGARRIDCEDSYANMLYEISFGGLGEYTPPISLTMRQGAKDKSDISIVQAVDSKGKRLDNLRMNLRTLEDDLFWMDQGSVY